MCGNHMQETKLRPFDLEAAKRGDIITTKNGHKVKIICYEKEDRFDRPIVALVRSEPGTELVICYSNKGLSDANTEVYDLMMAPKKVKGWINIFKKIGEDTKYVNEIIYPSFESAKYHRNDPFDENLGKFIATIPIEFDI